ncbi:LysR family transcriptional regulator [Roseomonas elaeocarpi]|uniref:LysR family transcriptional regulator n=1 Tax=Roseomonas elaeocarpi TaxID=907779 RepID=A0ABV6JWT6_9PROT
MTPARLRQLEAFRAVLRSGSVMRAAEMLRITQPAVTKLLRALEEDTNLVLFDRSRRRLVPTAEARRFEAEVELLFQAAKRVDRLANDMRSATAGEFRVAAMPSLGMDLLPRLLARLGLEPGGPRVSITVVSSLEVQDLVHSGQVELGFALPLPTNSMPVAAPTLRIPAALVLPPGHRLSAPGTVPLAALEGERCVLLGRQFQLGDVIEDLFDRHGVRPLYVAETQNAAAACAMVAAGMGVAVLDPVSTLPFGGRLVVRPLTPTVEFPVQVLAPPDAPPSKLARHFIAMLQGELTTMLR